MIKCICQNCGKEFWRFPSEVKKGKNKFCSLKCFYLLHRETVKCQYCGKEFNACKSNIDKGFGKFCSKKCANLAHRKTNEIIINGKYAEIIINSSVYGIKKVLIDKEYIEKVKNYNWTLTKNKSNKFYVLGNQGKKFIQLHRLITDCPKNMVVDHVNHDTLDNRKSNLKICTSAENCFNSGINSRNITGYKHISKLKIGKWRVKIQKNYKNIFCKLANSLEEAIKIRDDFYRTSEYYFYTNHFIYEQDKI